MTLTLQDSFFKQGEDLDEFKELIREIDAANVFDVRKRCSIGILSYLNEDEKHYNFMLHMPGAKSQQARCEKELLQKKGISNELILEAKASRMMMYLDGELVCVSQNIMDTLAHRILLGGQAITEGSPERDAYIASLFARHASDVFTLLIRQIGSAKKVFAVHSGSYPKVEQQTLIDIIDHMSPELGKPKCYMWTVTQNRSSIIILFPEQADEIATVYGLPDHFVPGIYLATSDTGDSSVTALGCWKRNDTIIFDSVFKRSHRGSPELDKIMDEISKRILDRFTLLPERLCELLAVEFDSKALPDVYDYIFTHTYGSNIRLKRILGQRLSDKIQKELEAEINPGLRYTGYDVACTFLDLPDRLKEWEADYDTQMKFRTSCGMVPYMKFENAVKSGMLLV